MEKLSLKTRVRELSKKDLAEVRAAGQIPAVVYGREFPNEYLLVDAKEYGKVYSQAGESTVINLVIDGQEPLPVIIQDQQPDPLTNLPIHIDFYKVRMDEKIETEIQLNFIGEPKAVKVLGGILVKSIDQLNVKCLPQDLVKEIDVDVSGLATFEDMIRIKDLAIPANLELLDDADLTVALVAPPRSEEELKSLDQKVEENVDKVEVTTAKPEAEEGAVEGEEAAEESKKQEK